MDRPVAGLAAAFTSLLSPISLVTIAAVAGAAALIQYFGSAADESKTVEDVLKEQSEAIKRVRDLWGEAAEQSTRYGRVSTQSASFGLQNSIRDLQKRLRDSVKDQSLGDAITTAVDDNMDLSGLTAPQFRETALFKALRVDFEALHKATLAGNPDVLKLAENLERIGATSDNAGIRQMAAEALDAIQPFRDLAEALRQAEQERVKLFNDRGPNGMLLSQGPTNRGDMGNLALYQQQQEVQRKREREAYEAELARMRARSPQERSAAARQSAAAEYNDSEDPAARRQRIELAGSLALLSAEKQLADARRSRDVALQTSIDRQQLEASLIGKTVSEQERLRLEFQLTSDLKAEAARNGTSVDEKELALIREKAAAYGQLAEQMAAQKALRDQDNELDKLRSELGLVTMSQSARAEALRQLETENKIRELGITRNSTEADQLREKSRLIGQMTTELNRQKEAWDTLRSAGETAIDNIFGSLLKGDFKGVLNGLIGDVGKFFQEVGTNSIKNMLLGGDRPELSDVIGRFMKSAGPAPVAANQNTPPAGFQSFAAPVMAVTRSTLPTTDIAAYITEAATKRGIDAGIALRVAQSEGGLNSWNLQSGFVKNGVREASYGPFQLYKGGGLGNVFQRQTGLDPALASSGPAGVDFALDHAKQNGWGAWYGAKRVGIDKWEGIGKGNEGADTASKALERLATTGQSASKTVGTLSSTASAATEGLGTFGSGLGQVGQNMANFFPAAPSSGGGGLFGSLLTAFLPTFVPNGAQANWAVNNPGKGLFDVGGHTGNGPRDSIAGFVHGQEFVVKASVVAQPGVRRLLEGLNSGSGYDQGGFVSRIGAPASIYPSQAQERQAAVANDRSGSGKSEINVYVDNPRGDRDIEDAVDRGVAKGLRAYDKNLPARFEQIKKRPYVRGQ